MIHFVKGFFKDMDRGIEFKADGRVNKCIDIAISAYHNKMRGSIILVTSFLVTTLLFGLASKLKSLMGFVHNSIIYDVVAGLIITLFLLSLVTNFMLIFGAFLKWCYRGHYRDFNVKKVLAGQFLHYDGDKLTFAYQNGKVNRVTPYKVTIIDEMDQPKVSYEMHQPVRLWVKNLETVTEENNGEGNIAFMDVVSLEISEEHFKQSTGR